MSVAELKPASVDSSTTPCIPSCIPASVVSKLGVNLYKNENHPICIIKNHIYNYLKNLPNYKFELFEDLSPYVSVKNNFDDLLIPVTHSSRSRHDTYYQNDDTVLRTHMTAHQVELLKANHNTFVMTGDVYRKDEIDSRHYPVFHQMDGVYIVDTVDGTVDSTVDGTVNDINNGNTGKNIINGANIEANLIEFLTGLVRYLFPDCEYRFNKDYFPFTEPSYECEVKYNGKWLEILGSGVIRREILDTQNMQNKTGWAFGLGIERLAMIFFKIPDIRLFWSTDPRFLSQFKAGQITEFKAYSTLNSVTKDISFWLNYEDVIIVTPTEKPVNDIPINGIVNDIAVSEAKGATIGEAKSLAKGDFSWDNINEFYEMLREICGDDIENVDNYDKFYNKKQNRYSMTFRLTFSPNCNLTDPSDFTKLTNGYMNKLSEMVGTLNVTMR